MARANPVGRRLSKLRGRSLHEWKVRGAQSLSILLERVGLGVPRSDFGEVRPPDPNAVPWRLDSADSRDAWLRHFRHRATPRFFASFDDRAETLAALRAHAPDDEAQTIRRADAVRAGRFTLLGYNAVSFGAPIDWQLDPLLGVRAPRHHWSRIRYLDPGEVGDHKLVWELNRHQFLVTLGQAYWYTGDDAYADAFARQLDHWIAENAATRGINWASALEVGFRAIAWLWALYFFKDSPRLTPALFARLTSMLALHARHLERYLSTYFSPNTHLTGEALALYYIGALLPELPRAAHWRQRGQAILVDRLAQHILGDGVYFERATWYHRYTVDFYLHALILGRRTDLAAPEAIAPPLERALEFLLHIARPDGRIPRIGDDDGGRLLFLDSLEPDDVRGALGTGAVLFRRPDFIIRAGPPTAEMIWLLGPSAAEAMIGMKPSDPGRVSRAFSEAGIYVLGDDWSDRSSTMIVDCGAHGALGCGHAHADALAFEFSIGAQPVLVDPGTYTYTVSSADRDHFRGTRSHNTATVDGEDSSVPGEAFSWERVASCRVLQWAETDEVSYLAAEHDGFLRLDDPTTHRREILFVKRSYWVIRDTFLCRGEHRAELGFQCEPGLIARTCGDHAFDVGTPDTPMLRLHWWAERGEGSIGDGWVSRRYGQRDRAPRLHLQVKVAGPTAVVTLLIPQPSALVAHRLETAKGQAFRVEDDRVADTVLFEVGASPAVDGVSTPASVAWVRRANGRVGASFAAGSEQIVVDGEVEDEAGSMPARGHVGRGEAR
jgi:hypothetical protein